MQSQASTLVIEGFALKKKRKKNQGYGKRWFRLEDNGQLSYSLRPNGHIREACSVSTASIGFNASFKELSIDSGVSVWLVRFLSSSDYEKWTAALRNYRLIFARKQVHRGQLALSSSRSESAPVGLCSLGDGLAALDKPLEALEALLDTIKAEVDHASSVPQSKLKGMFGKKGSKEGSTPPLEVPPALPALHQHLHAMGELIATLKNERHKLEDTYGGDPILSNSPHLPESSEFVGVNHPLRSSSTWSVASDEETIYHEVVTPTDFDIHQDDPDGMSVIPELASVVESEDEDGSADSVPTASEAARPPSTVQRRTRLPAGVTGGEAGIVGILRKNIGQDLSRIAMPINMNEPLSALQRMAEEFYETDLLRKAARTQDPIERICLVAAFIVSGLAPLRFRKVRKPFNPLLGETYELVRPDKGLRFIAEKCSHHPLLLASYAEDTSEGLWQFHGASGAKDKFYGRTLELCTTGINTLSFKDHQDVYRWNRPSTFLRNMLAGEKYIELVGEVVIESASARVELDFKEGGGMWSGPSARNKVQGKVFDAAGNVVTELYGRWDESLARTQGSQEDFHVLWNVDPALQGDPSQYGFTQWTIELNDLTDDVEDYLPPTDSRLRPDQRAFEEGHLEEAEKLKAALEQRQRDRRTELPASELEPRFFVQDSAGNWTYNGGYWEARQRKQWQHQPRIFDL